MITLDYVALGVSVIVCLFGCLTFVFARMGDHGKREHWQGQTTSQLSGISEDVKDMKATQRQQDRRLMIAEETANSAKKAADKAHKRLDMINAPSAYGNNGKDEK